MTLRGAAMRGAVAVVAVVAVIATMASAMSFAQPAAPAAPATTAAPAHEVHGHSDAFGDHGVAIAWAVLRGATEDATKVVLKIAIDHARYGSVAIDGVDPFGGPKQVRSPRTTLTSTTEVRIPRSQFADAPRTELRFFAPGEGVARLVVFYLGVPDTTPEFADASKLDAYLGPRIG